jgi:PTH1 family peptidyl-tRNA hydrolase
LRLIVGLGNPGPDYAATRHNVGSRTVEAWALRRGWRLERVAALESLVATGRFARQDVAVALQLPQTFMNRSGRAVAKALEHFLVADPEHLLVVYDDVDLPFGRLRLRPLGGTGGHRGLEDIQDWLGREDFPRLRVGIGRPADSSDVIDYVLSSFSPEEQKRLDGVLDGAVDAIEDAQRNGIRAAMNRVNAPPPEDPRGSARGPGGRRSRRWRLSGLVVCAKFARPVHRLRPSRNRGSHE